jgi:transcriptional regulator with XRE-family HTH domain
MAGLTQEEFGHMLGVSRQTINTYERDRQRPTMKMMERICDLQDVSPLWLFSGIGDPKAEIDPASIEELRTVYGASADPLSPEQRALVSFIVEDRTRAKHLARFLWDEVISRFETGKEAETTDSPVE